MQVETEIKQETATYTDAKPITYRLTLIARGNYQEIQWIEKQLNKIGKSKIG